MSYLKINQDDSKPVFEELDFPEEPIAWLDSCYNSLGCSSIETVRTVIPGIVLIIDEEGKLWDGWENRINEVASVLRGCLWDPIVGDAILARVDGENLVSLTSYDVDRLRRHFS